MKVAILIITLFLISCNSNSQKTDADNAMPDKDSVIEPDTETVDDLSDEVSDTESEVLTDTDVDTTVPCLDLRYNENTIKTNFPFKDKDGKPTFCRPGCDTPTETDPQCVRNIWEWHNIDGIQNYAGEGNIVGDHLTFITNNREIYFCDLRKNPKHINDCKKINRLNNDGITYELGHSPRIDTENENLKLDNLDPFV